MKYLGLSLLFFFSFTSQVWASDLARTHKNVTLKSWQNQLEVEITETWKNETEAPQTFTSFLPLPSHGKNIHLFVDKVGRSFNTLEGNQQKEKIFKLAKVENNMQVLKMAKIPFSKLVHSQELEVQPNESLTVKWKWIQDLDFISDFYFSSIFLEDNVKTENFKIELIRSGKIFHAISRFFSKGQFYQTENKFIWKFSAQDIKAPNFTFFISESENPKLGYKYGAEYFKLQFKKAENKNIFKNKTVLLFDNSGSMYGPKWQRINNLLPEILKNIPQDTSLKIGFFGKNISWIKEEFQPKNYENQKQWQKSFSYITPKGASDWQYFLEKLKTLKEEGVKNIILVGDFSDFPKNIDLQEFKNLDLNILSLDFSDQNFFKFFIHFQNGQFVRLFESAYTFTEKEIFLKALKNLNREITTPKNNTARFLPQQRNFISQESQVFISRSPFLDQKYSPLADFIPEIFGRYKVADYLRKSSKENLEESLWEALNSINRYFGLNISTESGSFKKEFQSTSLQKLWKTIWNLESENPSFSEIPKVKGKPFYGKPVSTGIDFHENGHLKVAPFSDAQLQLWGNFPEIFTPYFSVSNQVRFCTKFRCLEIVENGKKFFTKDMLLHWKGLDKNHWGYEFAEPLAKKNIIPVSESGKIEFAKIITRGEFIHWIYQFEKGENIINSNNKIIKLPEENLEVNKNIFIDLPSNKLVAKSILWMKEKGVIQGYADKTVRPNQPLTRAEAVKILLALKGFKPTQIQTALETNIFTDIHGWEKPWVHEAFKKGIIKGYKDKTFKPFNKLNYAEAFKLISQN